MKTINSAEKMKAVQSLAAILCGLLTGALTGVALFFPAAYIASLKYDHNEGNMTVILLILTLAWSFTTLLAATWACATMSNRGQEKKCVAIVAILPAAATLTIAFIPKLTLGEKAACILALLLPIYAGSLAGYKLALWQKKRAVERTLSH
ncbi:MAG: hypothetical protein DI535_13365 [Citrobacter freundii]|nr:MAG: hypothetical protein DI535_13365 [Citrobacter freundii]